MNPSVAISFSGNDTVTPNEEHAGGHLSSMPGFHALCETFGLSSNEHAMRTKDGSEICVYRVSGGTTTGVVLIYGGFGMGPEIWVCSTPRWGMMFGSEVIEVTDTGKIGVSTYILSPAISRT